MIVPWLIPILSLAAIVGIVVLLAGRRRRGKLPVETPDGASSTRV
jgi:hypothetical protein